jgi:hypothetical protein
MKLPVRSVAWLLPFLLTGCFQLPFHRKQPAEARMLAPHLQPSPPLALTPIELPLADSVIAGYPIYNMRMNAQPIRPPARHRRLNPEDATTPPEPEPSANPEVSAIGQLSSGDPADFRQQTESSIADIERRLNGINRALGDAERKTAGHIREFLKQARAAIASGDVEGAHTLAGKAEVLLEELTQ